MGRRLELQELNIDSDDAVFVRTYLDGLADKGTSPKEIQEAREYLEAWEIR